MGLGNKVSLVTGGGRGIGRAICERLATDGHTVYSAARSLDEVADVAERLSAAGGEVHALQLDVTDATQVDEAVKSILSKHSRIDVMVNSAGTSYIAPVVMGKIPEWEKVLDTNVLGAFIVSKAVVRPMLLARSGRIIHIGSVSGEIGAPYNAIYAASKHAIVGLVRSLALEVARSGITVNAVQPGTIKTKLFEETHGARARLKGVSMEEHEQDLIQDVPTRRFVEPEEIADAVAFLVSDGARSITGQMLNVDGGLTAL